MPARAHDRSTAALRPGQYPGGWANSALDGRVKESKSVRRINGDKVMEFLRAIEGKSGEELTTACLAFLLEHSPAMRHSVLGEMARAKAIKNTSTDCHFGVRCEISTEDAVAAGGFLDLLVETDDSVIGIENKLEAHFQVGQPFKYMDTLERLANSRKMPSGHSALSAIQNLSV